MISSVDLDTGWVEGPKVTNDLLAEKHSRFLDLKVRVIADQLITSSEEGVNARKLALSDDTLKRQVEQAYVTDDKEIRTKVDQFLDDAIKTISGGFDARIYQLNEDLRVVLSTSNWGLDRNLNAYRQRGVRAAIANCACKDRGTSAEVHQALQSKKTEIQEGSFSIDKFVQTDLETETIKLINLAINMRYIKIIGNKMNAVENNVQVDSFVDDWVLLGDSELTDLSSHLEKVLNPPKGQKWALDLNLRPYKDGFRARFSKPFKNRGEPTEVNAVLRTKLEELTSSTDSTAKEVVEKINRLIGIGGQYCARGPDSIYKTK